MHRFFLPPGALYVDMIGTDLGENEWGREVSIGITNISMIYDNRATLHGISTTIPQNVSNLHPFWCREVTTNYMLISAMLSTVGHANCVFLAPPLGHD